MNRSFRNHAANAFLATSCALGIFASACGTTNGATPPQPNAEPPHATTPTSLEPTVAAPFPLGACREYNARVERERPFAAPPELTVAWAESERVARCASGTEAHTHARATLDAFANMIEHSARDADANVVRSAFQRLLADRCFLPASEVLELPRVATTEGFRAWWEQGGRRWLEQYLTPMPTAAPETGSRFVVFPASEPRVLDATTLAETDPLRPLACGLSDESCDAESRPFQARLAAHLSTVERDETETHDPELGETERSCTRTANALPAGRRYRAWYQCMEQVQDRSHGTGIPIVHAHAPASGWLVVTRWKRTETERACAEMCAYDFAMGAAHCAEACGQHGAEARWPATVRRGNVSVSYLRELGWAMLVARDIDEFALPLQTYALPAGITPEWSDADESLLGGSGFGSGGGYSLLELAWVDGSCTRYEDIVATTDRRRPAEQHVGVLHRVLEASFSEGAPRAPAPTISVSGDSLRERNQRLADALLHGS